MANSYNNTRLLNFMIIIMETTITAAMIALLGTDKVENRSFLFDYSKGRINDGQEGRRDGRRSKY